MSPWSQRHLLRRTVDDEAGGQLYSDTSHLKRETDVGAFSPPPLQNLHVAVFAVVVVAFVTAVAGLLWDILLGRSACRLPSPPRNLLPNTRTIGGLARLFHFFYRWARLWRYVLIGTHFRRVP